MKESKKQMNKSIKIFLLSLIAAAAITGIYFGTQSFITFRKNVKHYNLINVEVEKFYTPNFADSKYTFIKIPESKDIKPAQLFNYEINYKNTGKQKVQNLIIETVIPRNCTLEEKNLNGLNYNVENGKLIIKIGDLNINDASKIDITFQIGFPLDNGLKIQYPSFKLKFFKENKIIGKSGYFNNDLKPEGFLTVKSSGNLSESYIAIDGSNENTQEKNIGDEIVYRIRLINKGNMNAKYITLKLSGLENLTFPDKKNKDFKINENTASAFVSELKAGEEKILYLYSNVSMKAPNYAEIIPNLEISSESFNSILKTPPKVIVKLFPDFSNSKVKLTDRNGGSTYSGEIVDALITIKNTGRIAANNVKVKINLSNLFILAEGQNNWKISKLEAGAEVEFNCSLKIVDGITKDSNAYCNLSISSDEGIDFKTGNFVIKVTGAKPFTGYAIPIIGFHEVEPIIGNPIELSSGSFDILCATLKNYGYQTITFQDLLDYLDYGKALPEKPVILSSDDGYQDIYTYAFPILKKYGYKMTVFLITNYIGNSEADRQTNSFDKNVSGAQVRPMLIWPEVEYMSKYGCEFLSHTASHFRLGGASADQIINELTVSKNAIESHIGKPCVLFSWPYDNYSAAAALYISKAGYRGGVVYGGGIEDIRAIDLRKIRRIPINGYNDSAGYVKLLNLQ